nr:thioredoxin superfamily protein [Tanacetum cinerariifolium]
MFICNHCPFVKHLKKDIVKLSNIYMEKGLGVVAISSTSAFTHLQVYIKIPEVVILEKPLLEIVSALRIEINQGYCWLVVRVDHQQAFCIYDRIQIVVRVDHQQAFCIYALTDLCSVAFTQAGSQILSTSFDGTARIHEINGGKLLKEFRDHSYITYYTYM